jgi:sugar phosphate isomerase/epimerase
MIMKRRQFVGMMGVGLAGGLARGWAQEPARRLLFGVCAELGHAEALKRIGFDFIEGGVESCLKPALSDEAFAAELEALKACALPIRSLNGFIPATFRLTGPDPARDAALEYAVRMCRRADAAGIPFIVFGSGGARKLPPGFPADQGRRQFIEFCRALGARIAELKLTIVLEPLNRGETNLLHTVAEGIAMVEAIDRPHIQLLADFFHMRMENEDADSIRRAGARLRHCHIAEKADRAPPGTKGEDMRDMFKALRDIGYTGGVSCECRWPKGNLEAVWSKALDTMRRQSAPAGG